MAGHTPLHPMYVSYSALPPAAYSQSNPNYQSYPRGTTGSNNSSSLYRDTTLPKLVEKPLYGNNIQQQRVRPSMMMMMMMVNNMHDTTRSSKSSASTRIIENVDCYNDYSNPLDHLHRPISPSGEYDSLENSVKLRFEKNQTYQSSVSRLYSPVVSPVMRRARGPSQPPKHNRNSYRPRIFTDHVREQPLRTFYSHPRLAMEQQNNTLPSEINDRTLQIKKRKKQQQRPLYSIEYSQPEPPTQDDNISPKPMTPRRVKRRSVISRDGTRRSNRRSSVRQSRRKNPVNRIMEQQESLYANMIPSALTNQNVTNLSQGTLNYDRIAGNWDHDRNINWQSEAVNMVVSSPTLWTPDPSYSNTANLINHTLPHWNNNMSLSRNLTDNWQEYNEMNSMSVQGQINPTFEQISTQSLHGEEGDELCNNRPASARSSYSNYHGIRATPQVPTRNDIVRQSQRQFVLNGPPAYQDTVI
ncbi:hypothetical protein PV327_006164 [Microctonus hyperodae]|uniref:Uncharacterized protein n=1 Tax=Microctonus hyperodae TaxID=165561 RepID=A0AA39L0L1_MICHY|nr:hypothetical protein PV327_006164 [Microctonus hyperodae]